MQGVLWLSRADKIVDKDVKFRDEYDYIWTSLAGNIQHDK